MSLSLTARQNYTYFFLVLFSSIFAIYLYRLTQPQWILYHKANSYFAQKEFKKAIELYKESLKNGLKSSKVLSQLAKSYVAIGDFNEAIELYRKYLEKRPKDKQARFELARVLSWNRDFDEAQKEYKILLDEIK